MTSEKIVSNNLTEWVNEKGLLHRLDGPAREYSDGYKSWWVDGKRHRVDGPAVECKNGYKEWFIKGVFFKNKECWFNALAKDEQITYLFNMEE